MSKDISKKFYTKCLCSFDPQVGEKLKLYVQKLKQQIAELRSNAIKRILEGWVYDNMYLTPDVQKMRLSAGGRTYIVPVIFDNKNRKTY